MDILMKTKILTENFNWSLKIISYFKVNKFTLIRLLSLFVLLAVTNSVLAQANIEFVENKGQWEKQVLYKGNVSNGDFYIRNGGVTMVQYNPVDLANVLQLMHDGRYDLPDEKFMVRGQAFNIDFLGSSLKSVAPDKPLPTVNNYFKGNDPSKWASRCNIYQAVTLQDVYPNIDVRYYTNYGYLKYDIIVKPGGNVSNIALKYNGVDNVLTKSKELIIKTSLGDLKESAPYTYQAGLTGKKEINCKYVVKDNVVRFDVKDYDPTTTLIIDPTVVFCSFSGSKGDNWGFTATYGPDGSMYGGGINLESGYPVSSGAFQTSFKGATDISIIKLTPNGSNRVYATYLGGISDEQVHSLVVDPQGNLVLAGRTKSPTSGSNGFPLKNGNADLVGPCGGWDIVLMKLSADGSSLIGSKRIGGSQNDGVNINDTRSGTSSLQRNYGDDGRSEVILDGAGNIYLAACTQSSNDFPVSAGAFQTTYGGGSQDGALIKYNSDLSVRQFISYLGGSKNDAAYVLSLAPNGDIFVAGGTESSDFPGSHAGTIGTSLNTNPSGESIDGFVAQIKNDGSALIRSTYIGTNGVDQVFGVQFDLNGFPYIMGQTTGSWPVVNAAFSQPGGKQFIAKLQPDLSAYVYSTCFGKGAATPDISLVAFLVDRCENVYISGWGGFYTTANPYNSAGTNGLTVTPDAIKSSTDGKDFYFFVLKKNAAGQLFGSFYGENNSPMYGGDHVDGGTSRFDKNGVIYQAICGNCNLDPAGRPSYPTTPGAWSTVNTATGAGCNLTLLKISMNLSGVHAGIKPEINGVPRSYGCAPLKVDFIDTVANGQSYEWHFNDGSPILTTSIPSASHTFNLVGTYNVMLVAIDPTTCNVRDTSYVQIRVGDKKATLAMNAVKLDPCTAFNYRFDNLSVASPGTPFTNTSFVWDFGDGSPKIIAGLASQTHAFTNPGTYNVKLLLQDTAYCNAPDSIVIPLSVAANVKAVFTTPPLGCAPYNAVFTNNSTAGQTFIWDFGDGVGTSIASNPTYIYNNPGTYIITLIANNPNTCNLSDTTKFTITVMGAPTADFSWTPMPPLENTPTTFTNLSSADAVRFKWVFGDGDSLLTTSRLPVTHQYNATGTFNACLTAYNAAGCPATVCKPVDAIIVPVVGVPNAFTPLSGDQNSIVYVRGFGIGKMTFTIWNRWGQKVFESNNQSQGWDGKVKGTVQPMDVYVYTLSVDFTDGTKAIKKGDITLIR